MADLNIDKLKTSQEKDVFEASFFTIDLIKFLLKEGFTLSRHSFEKKDESYITYADRNVEKKWTIFQDKMIVTSNGKTKQIEILTDFSEAYNEAYELFK
tara:strand:- start:1611 stop:1907 length:297 start_codon:yes stop_codon:yes gene_type:complete